MVVTSSLARFRVRASLLGCVAWALSWVLAGPGLPRAVAQDDARSLGSQLFAEAKAAKTLEEQNAVLQKIEKVREQEGTEAIHDYLNGLAAWMLHQRGETHAQLAAAASQRGEAAASQELDAKAMEDFNAALGLDPKRWKSYHHRGVCFALTGQFDKALKDFTRTVELRPDYPNAWFNRGEVHYEMGEYALAVKDYDEAIRLQPDDAAMYTSRGHAFFQMRRFPQALRDYHKAVELAPESSECYVHRGDAHRSLGQWEQAADDFRQAITRNREYGRAYQSAAWLMATCPDPRFRNAELAVRSARKALELDAREDYIYLDTLAAALASDGQFQAAEEVLRRAIQAAPQENAVTLQQRLQLYQNRQPYRQRLSSTAQRTTERLPDVR